MTSARRAIHTLICIAAALSIAGSSAASDDGERNAGWYAGLQAGAALTPNVVDASGTFTSNGTPYAYTELLSTTTGFAGGAFAGYKLPIGFRFEVEVTYRRNGLDELIDYSEFLGTDIRENIDGSISSVAYLVNAWYELDLGRGWMPYVGMGLGGATKFLDCGGSSCMGLERREDKATDFALQFGAGLAYALTPKTVLSLDYRYFDSIEADLAIVSEDFDYRNHNVVLGLRRHF
jgi:opacity protein-like surface antigen